MQLSFEQIDELKREYTDKLVAVDNDRPELRRFAGQTGRVRTVNMSGRALVEFDAYSNIGWYDIELDYLKVIDQPLSKDAAEAAKAPAHKIAEPKAAESKVAGEPAPAATKPASGAKKSTADILAAARAGSAGAAGAAPTSKAPAAPKTASAKPAEKVAGPAGGKLSTADILAAARAGKAATVEPKEAPLPETTVPEAAVPKTASPSKAASPAAAAPKPKPAASGKTPTTTAEKIAWCHEHDSK